MLTRILNHVIIALALSLISHPAKADPQADADAFFAEQEWEAAAQAFEQLLAVDPSSGSNWFALGQAQHAQDAFDAAQLAYGRALEAGFQPAARAHYNRARAYMMLGDREAALVDLEGIGQTGGPPAQTLLTTTEFEALTEDPRFLAVVAALTACATPEYRQFDFWLGEWDVRAAGSPTATASSRISSAQDGCVIIEEYTAGGFTGISLSFYDSATQLWHQTWMSNAGTAFYLEGRLSDEGAMVLTDAELPVSGTLGTVNRVTWTPSDDGTVRQFWETLTDGGESWNVIFDGHYTRRIED